MTWLHRRCTPTLWALLLLCACDEDAEAGRMDAGEEHDADAELEDSGAQDAARDAGSAQDSGPVETKCEVTPELNDLCVRAARAVGGGVVAIDVLEAPEGLVVNEVNYTMEFRNSIDVTGVNIPGRVVDYALGVATRA